MPDAVSLRLSHVQAWYGDSQALFGVGFGLVRFGGDSVSGVTVPAHAGGGVRVKVAPAIAVVAEGELTLGFGSFSRDVGTALQFGVAITGGVEFRLR